MTRLRHTGVGVARVQFACGDPVDFDRDGISGPVSPEVAEAARQHPEYHVIDEYTQEDHDAAMERAILRSQAQVDAEAVITTLTGILDAVDAEREALPRSEVTDAGPNASPPDNTGGSAPKTRRARRLVGSGP